MNLKNLQEFLNNLTSKKNAYNLIVVFLVGVLLLLVSSFFKSTSTNTAATATPQTTQQESPSQDRTLSQYERDKKAEVKSMLSKIKGIGEVEVVLTFESGEELVPAINSNTGTSVTDEKDNEGGQRKTTQNTDGETIVMAINGNDTEPYILKRIEPKVAGVVVVAQGADNSETKSNIMQAVSSLFAIPNYKIKVFPMKQ